jgi:adenylosuccinate lyase
MSMLLALLPRLPLVSLTTEPLHASSLKMAELVMIRDALDMRLLSNFKEVEEPIEARQIDSSAMAFKRSPMRSERICSLSRALMAKPASFANTRSTQWMERTLDDSAIRRMDLPETMLLAEAVLIGLDNVKNGLLIYPNRIRSRFLEELPFMVTEVIITNYS